MKKIQCFIPLAVSITLFLTVSMSSALAAGPANGMYTIESALSSGQNRMVLDVAGGEFATNDRANIQIWQNIENKNQKWVITATPDGYYTIKAAHSNKCLDVAGGGTQKGTFVWQYTPNNTSAQKWKFYSAGSSYYYLAPLCAPKMRLDVRYASKSNGTRVWIYDLNGSSAQLWKFIPTKKVTLGALDFSGAFVSIKLDPTQDQPRLDDYLGSFIKKKIFGTTAFVIELGSVLSILKNNSYSTSYTIPQDATRKAVISGYITETNINTLGGIKWTTYNGDYNRTKNTVYINSMGSNYYNVAVLTSVEKYSNGKWNVKELSLVVGPYVSRKK